MKSFGFTINVDKNTNYIIGHTESNWQAIRLGSLVQIGDANIFYNIGNVEPLNFITDFTGKDNRITIDGHHENLFLPDDVLTISYKEYELLTIKTISNPGSGYQNGDVLSLSGGQLSINIADNSSQTCLLQVEEVDGQGGIKKIKILNRGAYISFPELENKLNGGKGNGCVISIECKINPNRKMIERQVVNVQKTEYETQIILNYPLPSYVFEGKISMSKYKAYLTSTYVGETQRDIDYHIIRDYSPTLGLPLLAKGSKQVEQYYNYSIIALDKKIQELRSLIEASRKK